MGAQIQMVISLYKQFASALRKEDEKSVQWWRRLFFWRENEIALKKPRWWWEVAGLSRRWTREVSASDNAFELIIPLP
ncbi:hypothetical protein Nepgr_005440 [Nepenthes gracilis]|uniref:Uncharacterized protein n=1 Tax=Nepenthes gracilis TaxID=150966 RepID=A0AAD3XGL5_NEPGR|nr:hypothetical protein Nepgr_005440 [Nepenthes gracilis]